MAHEGKSDQAFQTLQDAIANGMLYANLLETDEDWDGLRKDQRYIRLLAKVVKADKAGSPKEGDEEGDVPDAD